MRVSLLLIAVGLIVVFKAGIWNLGMDEQFLLAAASSPDRPEARAAPAQRAQSVLLFLVAGAVGAAWTIVPRC